MKNINVSSDIIPVGEFKAKLAFYLKELQSTGSPLVITQNGKPAGVLLSPTEYDALSKSRMFTESVARGLSDAENGDVYTTSQLRAILKKNRSQK
jgi:antitoxin YefM